MKNWMKRGLSLLLVMAMVFGFIPMGMVTSAKAAEEGKATLLQDAAGVVWLVKAESGAYAPASTELINMLMDEQLDDMIRDAVGKDREDESVLVKYNGMNVGSLSAMTANFQQLNAMRTEIVDAISDHYLVTFNVGGKDMKIAFRNYANATIVFENDGKLYVEAGDNKPANLAQLRELIKKTLEDTKKVNVSHNGKVSLSKAGATYKINVKNAAWPAANEEPVKIGTVTVSLIPDDVTTATPVTATADVYIRDSRSVYTVTYQAVANGTVYKTESFQVFYGDKTPATTIVNGYTGYTWDKAIEKTVTGDVVYTANLKMVTVTYYAKDNTVLATYQVPDGAAIPELENDPYEGTTGFKGWYQKEVEGNLNFYPAFTENHVATLYYNDRGTTGVLRFEIKNGKVDPAINAYAKHPAKGVSTVGIIMESGAPFDPNGDHTEDINLFIIYFTDENGDDVKDGTIADPRYIYNVQIGKLNAEEELVFEVAETWTLEEEKYAAGELTTLPEIEYNPVYIGYAVDKWVVTLDSIVEGTHTYTIKPELLPDTNGNGIADKKEGTKLVIDAPNGCTVSYRINDEGEYEAVVSYKIGADTIESVIQISGLADDGWFMYQEGVTKVVASPAKSGEKVVWYVDDVKIDNTSIVAGYDKNYNAYNNATGAVVANQEIIERIMTVSYAEVPSLKFNDAAINAGFDPFASYENLEQTLYTGMVADPKPAYDADKIQIWYLSRNLDSDVQATIQLDGLKAYIETHYGAVLDLLPEGMEFPESLTVTLPAKQWTLVEESPARHNASAQAVADEFINRKIKEMENSKFSPDQLMTLAAELVSELTAEVENKALLNPFGTMYAGAPANLKVDYTTEKYKVFCGPEFVYFLDNRTQVDLGVIKDHIKLDYADFTDADLLANISLTAGGVKITDAKPELDRVAYYENMNAGTYTVTVSFSGNNKYKPAAKSVTFTLEIAKVTPVVEVEEFVITADDNYNYAPTVTPENAPIIQIIAGIEAMEFALDENMALADDEVTATVYVKIPQVYAQFLDGQQLDGYPVVEMGKFYTREQLVDALEEYAAHRNLPGKDAVNTLNELLDMIPDVVDNLQVYDMGLNKVSYKIRVDSIESKVYPTEPGIYVNYAASMGYIGKLLESEGNEYADLFLNDNYELSDLPGTDWKDPDNLLAAATMKAADYGIIVYTPMIPVPNINPNNGGIQLYDGDVANAQNLFVYEYEEGVTRELEVAYNKAKLEGEEPYYYGLTTRLDPTTAVPSAPGVYIAAYTYTKPVQNEDTGLMEVLRIDSDAAVIVIKPTEADLTITGGSFEYDGESKFPQISVTDKNGNVLDDANKTIISGTVNVKELSSNITANDLYGAVNIDFPNHWTIPGLELPDGFAGANRIEDAWDYYRTTFLNKAANDKFTPSDAIDFLEFCAKKTLAASDKAMELFERIGANEYVRSALNKVNNQVDYDLSVERLLEEGYTLQDMLYAGKANYFDVMIEYLRPLEDLDDNVWITMQDLETLDYSATGAYLYLGVITDPDLAIGVGKGLVIIHSADDYIMHDTHVPYDGQPHSVLMQDTTSRDDVVVILDRANDAKVAISTEKKEVIIEVDEALAQDLIDELNKILAKDEHINLQLSLDSSCTVGAAYIKTEKLANKLTDRLIASVRARSLAHLKKDGLTGQALEFALDLLDEKLEALYSKVLTKLQKIDTLENGTRIIVGDHLTFDLDAFEVTTIDLNADEVNIILDNDLFGALKKALEKEGYTLSKGSDGYIVTGYEKGDKALEKVINHVFDKLSLTANKLFDKTPYDTPAKLEAALAKLNEKLNTWKSALLDEVQKRDGMSDYTRIVINGKLPVEVGTYDFYGFDYDVARTTATLVIEPIYIEAVAGSGHKSYGTVAENPGATVNYYSYKTNPETLKVEKVPYTVQSVINAANLSYEVVVAENAAQEEYAPVGDYAVTFKNLTITESDRYVLVDAIDGVFTVEPTTFDVINVSEHTYNGTEQAVTYDIIDKLSGKPLSKDLFTISPVTAGIDAATYTFTVTAKDGSGYTGEVKVEWTIAPLAIDSLTATDLIYNGQDQNTTLTVKAGEVDATYEVIEGTITGKDAKTYTVKVKGTGNFTGEMKTEWKITPAEITEVIATDLIYNGDEQTTTLVVKAGDLVLTEDDYTVSGNTGKDVNTYTVTVTGKGNFTGSAENTWDITPLDITDVTATDKNYTGSEQTTDLTVTAGSLTATYEVVSGASATNAGTYTVKVKGTGNFSGELETTWKINAADFTVEATEEYTYNRQEQNAQFVIKFNGQEISKDDFVIEGVTAATNVGAYSFTVTAKADSNYTGSYTVDWEIVPAVIDSVTAESYVYNAQTQTTQLVVKAGDLVLTEDEYTVTGNTGKDVAEYTVTVTGKGNFAGSEDAKWNITPAKITEVIATDVTYNGQQQIAQLVVKAGELVLTEDDYTVTGNIGTNAGDYTVTVTGKGNFAESATDTWTIKRAIINNVEAADLVYNATEQTTTVVVKAGELTATYEVVGGNKGTDVNTYTVQVQGTGNFQGNMTAQWNITPAQITSVTATNKVYNGAQQTTTVTVMAGKLVVDTYTVTGNTGKDVDEYTVTVTGTGNFAGSKDAEWEITPLNISSVTAADLVYNATEQTTTVTVKAGELDATYNVISGNKGTNTGAYEVVVQGTGNFTGELKAKWNITPAKLTSVVGTNLVYNGTEQTTTLTVKAGELTATYDVISGNKGTNAGEYTVTVTGNGNFEGTVTGVWSITPAQITSATVTSTHTYNGAEQTAALVVKAGDLVLTENDYTVTGNKGTNAGDYTATVTGKGNFTGSATADWTIQNADFTVEVVGTYTYDGDVQNVQILVNGKPVDPNEFEVTGTTSGINAGDYFFTVTAKADGNYKGEFKDVKWTIAPLAIDSLAAADLVYNATEQTTTVTVKAGQLDATYNVISGNKGTNTGAYEVVVQGTGNFTGELKAKWNITPAEITSVVATDVTYTSQQQTATVVVKAGNLVVDTYTITGNVGTNAGDYTVKVVGTGNFKGEATDIWTIAPAQLTSVEAADLVYNATEQTTTLVVKAGELTATYDVVSGASATNAGTYTVKVKGTGNFAGTAENTWTIDPAQITSVTASDKVYNGQDQNTTLSVMAGALEATYEVIEGTITGKNADTYTVKVKGTGNFTGEKETTWKITPAKLTSVVGTNLVYNGTEQTTTLTVKAGELTATYDVISGNKGTNAGNYTVTVTGNGNFEGTVTGVWTIDRAMISEVIATNSVYTDAEQTTTLTVKAGELTATYDVVSGASATNAGTYTVKVVGTGNFAGEKETTWTIDPAVVKVAAEDKNMMMNESIPALTYTVTDVSGHVDSAKLVVTLVTAPTQNSAGQYLPGEYDITVTAESTANWTVEVEKGTLTVEAIDFICWNVQTGVYYDDVSVALGEAISGQIVQMLKDAHAGVVTTRATMLNGKTGEEIIIVPAGITFDLYGHYVQTKNLLSFGVVIDTVAAAPAPAYNADSVLADNGLHSGGILIPFETTEAWTQLQPENADYIPVYDTVTGSYKFFEGYDAVAGADTKAGVDGAIDAHDIGSKSNSSQVVFRFRLLFKDLEAYTVINGTEKSGLKVVLNIEWGGLHGMKVYYTMSDDLVSQHAGTQFTSNRGYVMTFTVKGLQGLGSGNWISAQPTIATQSGVLNNDAATLTYNIP